jgi:hypothetical protein
VSVAVRDACNGASTPCQCASYGGDCGWNTGTQQCVSDGIYAM